MKNTGIQLLRFVLFVAAQVLVFNRVNLGGSINPYIYILFLLMLPFDSPGWLQLIIAFLLGLSIDLFTHTPGLHTSAAVLVAFARPFIVRMISTSREIEPGMRPTLFIMGTRWYFLYSLMLIVLHHVYLFLLESMTFDRFFITLTQALTSAAITFFLAFLSQYLFYYKKK
ncbi:MAG: rod shape-determining protein MreD [Bacteroidia bacterium]|nr:rod shape-determining protein MreD [Bacteroidia bacterium]